MNVLTIKEDGSLSLGAFNPQHKSFTPSIKTNEAFYSLEWKNIKLYVKPKTMQLTLHSKSALKNQIDYDKFNANCSK